MVSSILNATGIIMQMIISNIAFPVLRALMIPNWEVASDKPLPLPLKLGGIRRVDRSREAATIMMSFQLQKSKRSKKLRNEIVSKILSKQFHFTIRWFFVGTKHVDKATV